MASTGSSNKFQGQKSGYNRLGSRKSNPSEQNWSRNENFDIVEYLQERKEVLKERYGFGKSKSVRCPRYYFINNKQSILIILQGDITRTRVDAIVNAANEHMTGGGGVDGIIHRAAGSSLYDACVAHKQVHGYVRLPTGHSRILLSYNMSETTYYIINTAGPIYERCEAQKCKEQLKSCYKTALALANLYDLESIGFTAISCGIFGYPADDGADTALQTVDNEAGLVPIIVFVLWDDHIYDAWVDKAKELNFTSFDIENPIARNPIEPTDDGNQLKTKSNKTSQQPHSPLTFNPVVQDFSTSEKSETDANDDMQATTNCLLPAPDDASDTQRTNDVGLDETNSNAQSVLHTQQTTNVANLSLADGKPLENNDSKMSSAEETIDKQHDTKRETCDNISKVKDQTNMDESATQAEKN